MRTAVGRRPAPDSARIDWLECATNAEVVEQMDEGGLDLAILDGEAQPTGGMGLARQFKYEIDDCPPIVVLIARPQDGWLASWSLADAVISQPLDPVDGRRRWSPSSCGATLQRHPCRALSADPASRGPGRRCSRR